MGWSVYYSEKYDKIALFKQEDSLSCINMVIGNNGGVYYGYIDTEAFIESDYELIGYL
jgi:hypothetical protein